MAEPPFPFNHSQFQQFVLPIVVGNFVMFLLWGAGLQQFFRIYRLLTKAPQLDLPTLIAVTAFFLADLADTIVKASYCLSTIRTDATTGLVGAENLPRTIFGIAFLTGLISAMTQLVYARRVYMITRAWRSKRRIWFGLAIAILLTIVQFAFSIWSGFCALLPTVEWPRFEFVAITWLGGSATVDCLLCLMLIIFLKSQKSSFQPTNDLLSKWVIIVLETGTFPAVVQILELSFYLAYTSKPYSVAINCLLPKTYILNVLFLYLTILTNRAETPQLPSSTHWRSKEVPRPGHISGVAFVPNASFVARSFSDASEEDGHVGMHKESRMKREKEDTATFGMRREF